MLVDNQVNIFPEFNINCLDRITSDNLQFRVVCYLSTGMFKQQHSKVTLKRQLGLIGFM